jgi:hypothetical protein
MVETLAPSGYAGRVRTTAVACATFTLGALAGGVITFGGLALIGAQLGANAPYVAAVIALCAAAGEARNLRIVPQVRRQVPESWRRVMPVPLAAGLYGVLLGLGFTTFILTFAVWALAGIAIATGDPTVGLAIGLAFGAGRALPVIALAPSGGGALHAAMAEKPRILRSLRVLDAAALALVAATLATAPAQAAVSVFAVGYADASLDGPLLALHRPGGQGEIRSPAGTRVLPGNHPVIGGGRSAYITGASIQVEGGANIPAPGADAVAVSASWVAWRANGALHASPIDAPAPRQVLAGNVGRPVLSGTLMVFAIDGRIEAIDLVTGRHELLRREARAELRGPSVHDYRLTYIKATYKRQQVLTGVLLPRRPASDRPLYGTTPAARRDAGHEPGRGRARGHINKPYWRRPPAGVSDTLTTTATGPTAVYFTRVRQPRGGVARADVVRVDL